MTSAFSDKRRVEFEILYGNLKLKVQGWGIAQQAECLPHKNKELSLSSSDDHAKPQRPQCPSVNPSLGDSETSRSHELASHPH